MSNFCTRDPVHGWIKLPSEVIPIINSSLFQRLYHIKQTASTELVYTGATHTRGAHSLGAAYLAKLYAQHLFPKDKEKEILLVCCALLHDIGHGPFSHIWDSAIYSEIYSDETGEGLKRGGHDQHRFKIVEYMKDIIDPIIYHNKILNVWRQSTNENTMLNTIVQGPLGADRMDFTLRDAYYTGTSHFGTIANERIIYNSLVIDQKLYYRCKAMGDITNALRARMYMYRKVYLHPTAVAGSILLEKAIKHGKKDLLFVEKTFDLRTFLYLTDAILYEMASTKKCHLKCQRYSNRYIKRILPKLIWEGVDEEEIPELEKGHILKKSVVKDYSLEKLDNMIGIWNKKECKIYTFSEALEKNKYGPLDTHITLYRVYSM